MAANRGTAALVVMACLLVAVTLQADATLVCNKVYGVKEQETCFAVAEANGLPLSKFLSFNPNINCQKVFVGQWVCLDATNA